ncbi:leucyl aminopeptidase [Methylovulum psychrotolerans]|uniref:Probable cytosol aminopeptidase n=1 Tax=Methylovulum psychrotolerans TaxID=1704499 RepID=A0A1Z4BW63_9GAMM|nr:leucyl aminopeptidase [Methylovulum psychrotolerans]ASF45534.1 leucyl aminopeptidase [Methylovulum psychrotolerans]POZ52929.1 leucyl aminopeptidase [Methylovulum psychrotolerans]
MDYSIETAPLETLECDCLIVGVYQDLQLSPAAARLNDSTGGLIGKILSRGDINGKNGETVLLTTIPDSPIERILLVGLGENKPISSKMFIKALAAAVNSCKKPPIKSVVCCLAECAVEGVDWTWKTRQIAEVFGDAVYQYTQTKSDKTTESQLAHIRISANADTATAAQIGLLQGQAIAEGVGFAKNLADLPGNVCTPAYLAEQAISLGEQFAKLSTHILEEADMQALGMGSLLSVSRGSRQPAKLISLDYQGGEKNSKPIVLIGKGLTFDAGGISLKPGLGMDEMKYDMCGGAAVLGALLVAARLNLPLNIIGLVPASENLPDGDANKPGDIVTSMSGKTIEILNTDAEGRLILCDTLTYAERYHPDVVIDMATLTGACLVALGRIPSGLLGNDDALCDDLIAASETANDSLWRLPLWEEYQELLKSNFADMANIGGKDAGTITAACFLSRFAESFRWAHLDIAGTAWRTGQAKGATGRPVPLLSQYLLNRAAQL